MVNPSTQSPPMPRGVLAATLIGNFVEWFDFAVYGALAVTLAAVFFPTQGPAAALSSSLAVFAIGFVFRPLGGALLGYIGDRYGRRAALAVAVVGMSGATTLIALLPSYETIGIAAPLILVLLRAIQGLSAGGEWTSAGAFLAEYAPHRSRGLWLSMISVSAGTALASGILAALALRLTLSPEALLSWGWRIPFLAAAPLGLIGLYLRVRLNETPVFRELQKHGQVSKTPLREALRNNRREMVTAFACASITGLSLYYFATYFVSALSTDTSIGAIPALTLCASALLIYSLVFCPLAGALSDRIGRKPVYLASAFGIAVLSWPIFALLDSGDIRLALVGLLLYAIPQSGLNAMVSVTLVELFPPRTRSAGAALAYGLGLGPIAGTGPLVANWLKEQTGSFYAPAAYLAVVAVICGCAIAALLPETRHRSLSSSEVPDAASAATPPRTAFTGG